ncbi:MAG: gamma-glutamylcyclotransferase [Chromatiaceae bacterium]|nr:gamma-glutamylcyclotransferase [Chromatiaceae bacterium]MCP5421384.1 gamma-glutamylcyclotransferase [Chromatiaceae bacterium]
MLYFAYGSNMSTPRLRRRVPSAEPLARAVLHDHRLTFHKVGRDGSAKCDIVAAPPHLVHGVVFRIEPCQRAALDHAEGLGEGYDDIRLQVRMADGSYVETFAYRATRTDPDLEPFTWYVQHVLRGAFEHGLPDDYIRMLRATRARPDPDTDRDAREMAVHVSTAGQRHAR